MIRRVFVDNYRCLINFEFRPDRVNLLIGANGSGKSAFFEAVNWLWAFARGQSVTTLPASTLPWGDKAVIQTFEIDVRDPDGGDDIRYQLRVSHAGPSSSAQFVDERLTKGKTSVLSVTAAGVKVLGENGQVLEAAFQGPTTALSSGLGGHPILGRFRAVISGISFFRINPYNILETSSAEDHQLKADASNFAAWLRYVATDRASYVGFLARIAEALPQLKNLRQLDLGGDKQTLVAAVTRGSLNESLIPFSDFSEGEKCLCVLHAIAAFRPSASSLFLDEPDNFLSLREVQPLLSGLVEGGSQLFVVTHHPEAIDYLAADSSWLFERPSGEQVQVSRMVFDRSRGERPSETVRLALP